MAITKISDLSSLFNTIYEDALFIAREMNLMLNLVEVLGMRSGYAQRDIPIWGSGEILEKGEGVDFVTNKKFSKSLKASFTPTVKMGQFILTDEMRETDQDGAVAAKASRELGLAMAEKMDKDLIAVFADFTNSVGSAGNALTLGMCAAAQVQVRRDNGKGRGNFVLAPEHWHDIWVALGTPAATAAWMGEVATEALREYYKSNIIDANWFVSNHIERDGDSDAVSGYFLREAIGFDPRKGVTFEEERDASKLAWEINVSAGYDVGTIYAEYGAKITADATEPTS
jgi:hypothetical protein